MPAPFSWQTISIPSDLGQIEESYTAPRTVSREPRSLAVRGSQSAAPLIVYLQDAHDSLEAQEHIAKLIHYFVEHYGVRTVFEEGYEGPVPTDEYFGFIQDPQIKEKVSYFLLDKLRIGGAEYAHINRCQKGDRFKNLSPFCRVRGDFQLIGADNIKLHLENIRWYQENAKHKEETEEDLTALSTEITKLANQHFPRELKEWMKLKKRFDEKQIPLLDYLKRTLSLRRNAILSTSLRGSIPNEAEALTPLVRPASGLIRIPLTVPSAGRDEAISVPGLLRFARNDGKDYPDIALLLYAEHTQDKETLEKVKQIDPRILFQEIDQLEDDFANQFLQNKKGTGNTSLPVPFLGVRKIFRYHKTLNLLKRLNQIEVTPAEYDASTVGVDGRTSLPFDTQSLARFIVSETHGAVVLSRRWERNLRSALRFYEIARARDQVLEKHLERFVKGRDEKVALLVFGGFHKDRIKEIFARQDLSYVIVTPRITEPSPRHQAYYKQLMSVGRHPFEVLPALRNASPPERIFEIIPPGDFPSYLAHLPEGSFATRTTRTNSEWFRPVRPDAAVERSDRARGEVRKESPPSLRGRVSREAEAISARGLLRRANRSVPDDQAANRRSTDRRRPAASGATPRNDDTNASRRAEVHPAPTGPGTPQSSRRLGARAEVRETPQEVFVFLTRSAPDGVDVGFRPPGGRELDGDWQAVDRIIVTDARLDKEQYKYTFWFLKDTVSSGQERADFLYKITVNALDSDSQEPVFEMQINRNGHISIYSALWGMRVGYFPYFPPKLPRMKAPRSPYVRSSIQFLDMLGLPTLKVIIPDDMYHEWQQSKHYKALLTAAPSLASLLISKSSADSRAELRSVLSERRRENERLKQELFATMDRILRRPGLTGLQVEWLASALVKATEQNPKFRRFPENHNDILFEAAENLSFPRGSVLENWIQVLHRTIENVLTPERPFGFRRAARALNRLATRSRKGAKPTYGLQNVILHRLAEKMESGVPEEAGRIREFLRFYFTQSLERMGYAALEFARYLIDQYLKRGYTVVFIGRGTEQIQLLTEKVAETQGEDYRRLIKEMTLSVQVIKSWKVPKVQSENLQRYLKESEVLNSEKVVFVDSARNGGIARRFAWEAKAAGKTAEAFLISSSTFNVAQGARDGILSSGFNFVKELEAGSVAWTAERAPIEKPIQISKDLFSLAFLLDDGFGKKFEPVWQFRDGKPILEPTLTPKFHQLSNETFLEWAEKTLHDHLPRRDLSPRAEVRKEASVKRSASGGKEMLLRKHSLNAYRLPLIPSSSRAEARTKRAFVQGRRNTELEILNGAPEPLTRRELTQRLNQREGLEEVSLITVTNDTERDSRLRDHPKLQVNRRAEVRKINPLEGRRPKMEGRGNPESFEGLSSTFRLQSSSLPSQAEVRNEEDGSGESLWAKGERLANELLEATNPLYDFARLLDRESAGGLIHLIRDPLTYIRDLFDLYGQRKELFDSQKAMKITAYLESVGMWARRLSNPNDDPELLAWAQGFRNEKMHNLYRFAELIRRGNLTAGLKEKFAALLEQFKEHEKELQEIIGRLTRSEEKPVSEGDGGPSVRAEARVGITISGELTPWREPLEVEGFLSDIDFKVPDPQAAGQAKEMPIGKYVFSHPTVLTFLDRLRQEGFPVKKVYYEGFRADERKRHPEIFANQTGDLYGAFYVDGAQRLSYQKLQPDFSEEAIVIYVDLAAFHHRSITADHLVDSALFSLASLLALHQNPESLKTFQEAQKAAEGVQEIQGQKIPGDIIRVDPEKLVGREIPDLGMFVSGALLARSFYHAYLFRKLLEWGERTVAERLVRKNFRDLAETHLLGSNASGLRGHPLLRGHVDETELMIYIWNLRIIFHRALNLIPFLGSGEEAGLRKELQGAVGPYEEEMGLPTGEMLRRVDAILHGQTEEIPEEVRQESGRLRELIQKGVLRGEPLGLNGLQEYVNLLDLYGKAGGKRWVAERSPEPLYPMANQMIEKGQEDFDPNLAQAFMRELTQGKLIERLGSHQLIPYSVSDVQKIAENPSLDSATVRKTIDLAKWLLVLKDLDLVWEIPKLFDQAEFSLSPVGKDDIINFSDMGKSFSLKVALPLADARSKEFYQKVVDALEVQRRAIETNILVNLDTHRVPGKSELNTAITQAQIFFQAAVTKIKDLVKKLRQDREGRGPKGELPDTQPRQPVLKDAERIRDAERIVARAGAKTLFQGSESAEDLEASRRLLVHMKTYEELFEALKFIERGDILKEIERLHASFQKTQRPSGRDRNAIVGIAKLALGFEPTRRAEVRKRGSDKLSVVSGKSEEQPSKLNTYHLPLKTDFPRAEARSDAPYREGKSVEALLTELLGERPLLERIGLASSELDELENAAKTLISGGRIRIEDVFLDLFIIKIEDSKLWINKKAWDEFSDLEARSWLLHELIHLLPEQSRRINDAYDWYERGFDDLRETAHTRKELAAARFSQEPRSINYRRALNHLMHTKIVNEVQAYRSQILYLQLSGVGNLIDYWKALETQAKIIHLRDTYSFFPNFLNPEGKIDEKKLRVLLPHFIKGDSHLAYHRWILSFEKKGDVGWETESQYEDVLWNWFKSYQDPRQGTDEKTVGENPESSKRRAEARRIPEKLESAAVFSENHGSVADYRDTNRKIQRAEVRGEGGRTLKVEVRPDLSYEVKMTRGVFDLENPLLAREIGARKVFVVVDEGLGEAQIRKLKRYLRRHGYLRRRGGEVNVLILSGGERVKNERRGLGNVLKINQTADRFGLSRKDVFLLVGGGAVLDVGGFAASLFHRGIPYIRAPSTLLSQIDAGIGVKAGINYFHQKNFLGSFYPPQSVLVDPVLLQNLDARQMSSGMAEAIKVALMKDRGYLELIEKAHQHLLEKHFMEGSLAEELMWRSIVLHLAQIETDPFETKLARPLDYGHQWGHRLEYVSRYKIAHGEGVAIGMAIDSFISYRRGLITQAELERILSLIKTVGLPIYHRLATVKNLWPGLESFRKHLGGRLTISLLDGIGRKKDVHELRREELKNALAYLRRHFRASRRAEARRIPVGVDSATAFSKNYGSLADYRGTGREIQRAEVRGELAGRFESVNPLLVARQPMLVLGNLPGEWAEGRFQGLQFQFDHWKPRNLDINAFDPFSYIFQALTERVKFFMKVFEYNFEFALARILGPFLRRLRHRLLLWESRTLSEDPGDVNLNFIKIIIHISPFLSSLIFRPHLQEFRSSRAEVRKRGSDKLSVVSGKSEEQPSKLNTYHLPLKTDFPRAEVRVGKKTEDRRRKPEDVKSPPRGKYAVVVDMAVFDALEDPQKVEIYKLFAAYPQVKFVFLAAGDRTFDDTDGPFKILKNLERQFRNVEIRMNPMRFDFAGRKILSVTKEGVEALYADRIEERLLGRKNVYRVRYASRGKEAGLLTAALRLLVDLDREDVLQRFEYFSEIPAGWASRIQGFLDSYVYLAYSA